jgi:hypothetical protein
MTKVVTMKKSSAQISFSGLETKTPWGVILKPVPRGRPVEPEYPGKEKDLFAFEKTETKRLTHTATAERVVYKRVNMAACKMAEKADTRVPIIKIEPEVG